MKTSTAFTVNEYVNMRCVWFVFRIHSRILSFSLFVKKGKKENGSNRMNGNKRDYYMHFLCEYCRIGKKNTWKCLKIEHKQTADCPFLNFLFLIYFTSYFFLFIELMCHYCFDLNSVEKKTNIICYLVNGSDY